MMVEMLQVDCGRIGSPLERCAVKLDTGGHYDPSVTYA